MLLNRIGDLLRHRLLRNVLLWLLIFFLSHGMSMEADALHHYGFRGAAWYWRVLLGWLALQLTLVYVNNLVLVPQLLVKRRRWAYAISLFFLLAGVSLCCVIGYKAAALHIPVSKMELISAPSVDISPSWSLGVILSETWVYVLGNLIFVSLFTMAWYMNDYARQRKDAAEARAQQAQTELAFLHSQLAPHFLFNTLNNIYALSLRESGAAPEAMLKLAAILRSLLYERGDALVAFEKEASLIRAYIDLELLRLKNLERLRFEIDADNPYSVAPLLWLPILENSFKHGTRIISEQLFVEFSYVIKEGVLRIHARNYVKDGSPLPTQQRGIGLENLQRRLQLLYPDKHTYSASLKDHVFTCLVTVNLL